MAPAIGARKSIQDCPARQDIMVQPSASSSQIFPSYATVTRVNVLLISYLYTYLLDNRNLRH